MTRVGPGGQEGAYSNLHHHEPNKQHFGDVAHSNREKEILVNFEEYTVRESDEDIQSSSRRREDGGSRESSQNSGHQRRHHHHHHRHSGERRGSREEGHHHRSREHHRSRDSGEGRYDRGDSAPPLRRMPQTPPSSAPASRAGSAGYPPPQPPLRMKDAEKNSGFITCDILAAVIALAYIFAIAILILAMWCYRQDSKWNSIVHNERAFPKIVNEDFFSGKYLWIYTNNDDEGLPRAKVHLLRENRWLELMHLMFISAFLILTVFQFAAYVTRGVEDHSKLIICYYTVFGGLGLIVALFPMLSWHNQEYGYKASRHYLSDFARRVWNASPDNWRPGLSNATAQDAYALSRIMKFCYDASQKGVTIDREIEYLPIFKRRYRLTQLQTLGFCTHHKYKLTNTILTTVFAIICCIVPCVYCFKEGENLEDNGPGWRTDWQRRDRMGPPGQGPRGPLPRMEERDVERGRRSGEGREDYPEGKRASHYTRPDGRELSNREKREIQKWIRYVEGDDYEYK